MNKDLENQIISFNNLYKNYDALFQSFEKQVGLPRAISGVLFTLEEYRIAGRRVCTQKDITDLMLYSKQSINSAIRQLVLDGYVTLESIRGNKKSKNICLTEKGERLIQEKISKIATAEYRAFSRLSEEERKELLYLFSKVSGFLKEEFEEVDD